MEHGLKQLHAAGTGVFLSAGSNAADPSGATSPIQAVLPGFPVGFCPGITTNRGPFIVTSTVNVPVNGALKCPTTFSPPVAGTYSIVYSVSGPVTNPGVQNQLFAIRISGSQTQTLGASYSDLAVTTGSTVIALTTADTISVINAYTGGLATNVVFADISIVQLL